MALTYKITYLFQFSDGRSISHEVEMDRETGSGITGAETAPPEWTRLENHKCKHCPLDESTHPYCPVAVRLARVAEDFKMEKSYDKVIVEVTAEERQYRNKVALQDGLFSLFGLLMATSECPYFKFLRPMARYHLPFSSFDETLVRSTAFYLLRQFFNVKRGLPADFTLKQLSVFYAKIEAVNQGMTERIHSVSKADADANSVVILDAMAKLLGGQLRNELADFDKLFAPVI